MIQFLGKCGNDLSTNPLGILDPLIICWPTQATIWETLIFEPFDPQRDIIIGALNLLSSAKHTVPTSSLILLNIPDKVDYSYI